MAHDIEELACEVIGSRRSQLRGGGREDNGIKHKVDSMEPKLTELYSAHNKGGLGGLARRDRIALWAAVISALAVITAALIGLI